MHNEAVRKGNISLTMMLENLFRIRRLERDEGDKRNRAPFCLLIQMGIA